MYFLGHTSARPASDHLSDRTERPHHDAERENTDRMTESASLQGERPWRDREEPIWPLVSREELALIAFAPFLRS